MRTQIVHELVARALEEDIGSGDATTEATVDSELVLCGRIMAREPGILAGRRVVEEVFAQLSGAVRVEGLEDRERFEKGAAILQVTGPARALLTGERVALNFLQRMCGIATLTSLFVERVAGSNVSITDTRKTTPTLRELEKYAVRCGGGVSHRFSLGEMLLIKENHIAAAGSIEAAIQCALSVAGERQVEVEVRHLNEFERALQFRPHRIMLDHWIPSEIEKAILKRGPTPMPSIEVSGNVDLESVARFAVPGVQFISVGALTHSAPALDLSLLLEGVEETS